MLKMIFLFGEQCSYKLQKFSFVCFDCDGYFLCGFQPFVLVM